jgi:hypothetical protein
MPATWRPHAMVCAMPQHTYTLLSLRDLAVSIGPLCCRVASRLLLGLLWLNLTRLSRCG